MKRTVEFLDADHNKVVAECEITQRNGYDEFTMSGDYGGGLGQVFDEVTPDGENQQELIDIWREWHLNGMSAGTPEQDNLLKENGISKSNYNACVDFLKAAGLFEVKHPETGELFKYGHAWYHKQLPEDFENDLDALLDDIEAEEESKQERPVEDTDIDLFEDFGDSECALALALMLDLCVNEIGDIVEECNNRWCVQGTDYVAGTDDEMDGLWDEDLDNYLKDCVYPDLPDNMRIYFDDEAWKRDAKMDGRGHSLNRYDGGELDQKVNGTYYYAYRQ
jgi:hypothetical protein